MVEFTIDAIKNARGNLEETQAYIRSAATAWKGRDKVHGLATMKAANAAFLALEAGILVRGRGATRHDWTMKSEEYGAKFDNLRGGGVGRTQVNYWMALGYAINVCGVDPMADRKSDERMATLWQHLAHKGAVQKAEVQEVIYRGQGEDTQAPATWEDIEDVVRRFIAPDGSRMPTEKAAPAEPGEGDAAESDQAPTRSNIARATAALALLASLLPELTTEEFGTIPEEHLKAVAKSVRDHSKALKESTVQAPELAATA